MRFADFDPLVAKFEVGTFVQSEMGSGIVLTVDWSDTRDDWCYEVEAPEHARAYLYERQDQVRET